MMSMEKTYNPQNTEDKWYAHWEEHGFFQSKPNPDKEAYSIVIPPPNVTGVLHMGHMLNNTIQDVLIRRARMQGKEACWVPGTDHASIATEAKVVKQLREQGIKKSDLTREEFLEHAYAWKDKYGGIILKQLRKLGASCDWSRERFTMEPKLYKASIQVFIDLYKKGKLYRDLRMINWDPEAKTALSNEEVLYKEEGEVSKLYHVRYRISGTEDEWLTIATTRPETILADTAIAVNPDDERYSHLKGKKAIVPFTGREVPVIFDDYVDKEFGTGCLKVTPAHDRNDYEIGQRHDLEVIDILNDDGTVNEIAGRYIGQDRFEARKHIVKDLEEAGQLVKTDEIMNKVGRSERTGAVVEPKLSLQWFVDMKQLAEPALKAVEDDEVQLVPPKFKNTYRHWMVNIRDWCISRQLWWGIRIPAWYYGEGKSDYVVAETEEEAFALAREANPEITREGLKQDEDVLDTWFSSWLWPLSVFDAWEHDFNSEEINYYYPTNALVTGPDILFLWVARMIMMGYEFKGEKPFKDVYLTGLVRDKQRRKMSKSLGNSPDALELIAQYGADGVRTGILLSASAGNDLLFDEKLCEQGRNFTNKIWNALRLIKGWELTDTEMPASDKIAVEWFASKLNESIAKIEEQTEQYRLSDALMLIYKLIWDDFCSWYLEMIKPEYGKPASSETVIRTNEFFETLMKLLHPFMPFLTEEVWHQLAERGEKDCIIVAEYPKPEAASNDKMSADAERIFEAVSQVRNIRLQKNIPARDKVELHIRTEAGQDLYSRWEAVISKLCGTETPVFTDTAPEQAMSFVIKGDEFFVPVEIDPEAERQKLSEELEYTRGFLKSVEKKLSNERFVQNAPEQVVEKERQKQADAEAKIKALEENLASLK